MVDPSALAVLRLTTKSNFSVGCSTGRSAGLALFKVLSTKMFERARPSRMLGCIRSALLEPNLMTPHVKVQRPAVQIGLILDAGRSDGLEAGRALLAGTLTCPHAPGVIALDIARPEHSSNALADLFF